MVCVFLFFQAVTLPNHFQFSKFHSGSAKEYTPFIYFDLDGSRPSTKFHL